MWAVEDEEFHRSLRVPLCNVIAVIWCVHFFSTLNGKTGRIVAPKELHLTQKSKLGNTNSQLCNNRYCSCVCVGDVNVCR